MGQIVKFVELVHDCILSKCQRAGLVDGDICSTLPVDSYKDKRTPVII